MRVAILESIVMPAGHEVEFDRILINELKRQGHEPVLFRRWRGSDLCRCF